MNTQTLGRKNIELLIVILLLNISAGGCYIFLFREIKAKNEHISGLVNQIEAEANKENMQNSMKTLIVETAPLREKLDGYVIGQESAVSFLELLERIGSDVGAAVDIESVGEDELQQGEFESLRLMLKVNGEWSEVVRFLGLLELLPVEGKVKQVTVSRSDGENEEPWQGALTFIVLKAK